MPRKAEIQAEETATSSPLRRSNRKTAVNSPAPATLATRRTSQTHEAPKTRRASLSQDNTDKDEKTDNKSTTRGRRASTTKEEPETKPEPAKTRGRRSSASTESTVEESKPQTATRRRRSSAAEDLADAETLKPIRTRRSSATEKPPEEEPAKRTTRTRRGSVKEEEPKEEPVKRAPRSRRGSVDTADSSEPKEKKPNTRGRRLSTDEPEREPETKTVKLTPVKSRRRLSVTENAVNLEPIEELESEIKSRHTNSPNTNEVVNLEPIEELKSKIKGRNSSSPISKEKVIHLTPVKPAKPAEVKEILNLSIINETSIVEETQDDKDTSEGGTVTPRRSPRLSKDKQKSAEKLASPSSSPLSHLIMEEKQSPKPDMKDLSKEEETAKEHLQSSPKQINFTDAGESKNLEKDVKDETFSEKIETITPKKEQAEQNEEDNSPEDKSEKSSVSKTLTEVENCNISMGSDGSFKFHLNVSISASQNESIQEKDDLNSSKSSNTSDKENISTNSFSTPKKNSAEGKEQGLDSLTNTPISEKNVIQEEIVVARVSNVFRPKMKENSFMEPMEVDEYPSILDSEQPEESDIGGVLATPTLTTKQNFKDIEIQEEPINKNVRKSLIDGDGDSVGDSFYLNLSNGAEENDEKPKDVSEDVNQDKTAKIKTPENFSNSKDEHIKLTLDVKDSSEQVDNQLKTSDEDVTSSEMKPHVLEEISREETGTTTKIDLEITDRNISLEKIQDQKETPLSGKLKNNDLESEALDDIKKQEVKTSQSDKSYENLEASGKERRRSKSPSFICVQTDDDKKAVSRKSKSPQPTEHVPKKSKSPMLDLRRSKSPLSVKEKSSRKSKSPTSQSSPKKSKSSQSTKLQMKEQNVEKFVRSASPSALQDKDMPTDDVDISSVNAENVMDESSSLIRQFSEKSSLQGKEITDITLNPTGTDEKKADDVSMSPGSSIGHSKEGIHLRKLKSPLIHAKNQSNEKLSFETSIDANPFEDTEKQGNIADSDVEEKMDVKSENSITYSHEDNLQEGQNWQSKYGHLKSGFSLTESPGSQNLKISDIEVEVRRRSKSPESLRRSTSPQSDSTMPEKLTKSDKSSTEEINFKLEKTEYRKQTEEQINKFNMETCEDFTEKSESLSSNRNESKDLDTESKQPLDAAENTVNMPPKESIKSDTLDDYDFELPSDEEEAEKTRAAEYDQSTVVTSYIATSQLVGDVSTSTEMETVILVDKKKINDSEVYTKENSPVEKDSSSSQNSKEIELELDIQQMNEKENLNKKSGDEELLDTMQIPKDHKIETEIDDDRGSEDSNELKDEFVDEVQTHELKEQNEIAKCNEEKINNSDMKSPQKKLKVRKYSLKKTMESYLEDMERSDNEKKDSEEENENKLHRSKTKKKSKKRHRVVEKDIEKDDTISDDGLEVEVAKKKNLKSKKLILKKGSDSDIENVAKQKKARKSKEFVSKKLENVEDAKSNDKKSAKKKIKSPKPIKQSTTEEDSNLEETTNSEEHNEQKSKKKTKSVSVKMTETAKERYAKQAKDDSKKSPASVLDEFVTKKIAEMTSDESFSEDENPEEPNEYVCTMAEEGEEDTPSEDSNAIIDYGESVGSTESEYGSDDEYDENDSFICDDEEEQLLSGEESDLNAEKKKKSRIIQLDSYDDDIIKIQKKEKLKPVEKKKTRIISITDSSESDEDEGELYKVNDSEEIIKPAEESTETQEVICVEEKTDEEVFIVETKPITTSLEQSPNASAIESPEIQQRTEKKRLSSITIHENIDVKEIKSTPLSERISHLVDSFCTSMRKGEISMNLSIECCAKDDDSGEEIENSRRAKKRRLSGSRSSAEISKSVNSDDNVNLEENIEETSFKPPKRLSVSMNNLTEAKKRAKKRKLSHSMDNLDQIETKSKRKKTNKKKKRNVEKKAIKSPKPSTLLEDDLKIRSLGLLNQLITDIKNRPRRTVKPSTNMNNSWITEVAHVKPSTSAFDKEEKAAYKAGKVHPKDFRSQMLNDPSRVRRIETKALLRKKGVHL